MKLNIFYADYRDFTDDIPDYPISEYRKAKLLRTPERRQSEQLLTELYLIKALQTVRPDIELPLNIKTGEYGKPFIPGIGISFNISHSEYIFMCAIADTNIGVDIQRKVSARRVDPIAIRFFTEDEQRVIAENEDKEAMFTSMWTIKESYLKALGTGLHSPLSSVNTGAMPDELSIPSDSGFRILRSSIDDYFYAVCYEGEDNPESVELIQL